MSGPARGAKALAICALVLCALAALAGSIYAGIVAVPERFNPWAALDVESTPNLLTPFKMHRARSDPQRCRATLALSGMSYEPVKDRVTGEGCGFENAVRLTAGRAVKLGSPAILSCPMALSFAMWERHALEPAALARMGSAVAVVDHVGSYACRDVNTGRLAEASGRRSRHATADAIDISGFRLADGRKLTVKQDWSGGDASPAALFLHDAHAGGCRFFEGVLGPDYNDVHLDHFHFEAGGWRSCK